ncbi:hypothetical protein NQ317_012962 [Molorchus minor]|uniref:Uncharacterized protein n=1 Tax=Molorchus minor TaxID=1323400 RepID=A0ABQ9IXG7_9CUCU|nr:hypothetical protein NQ317_012962 [Molorchus minor]
MSNLLPPAAPHLVKGPLLFKFICEKGSTQKTTSGATHLSLCQALHWLHRNSLADTWTLSLKM